MRSRRSGAWTAALIAAVALAGPTLAACSADDGPDLRSGTPELHVSRAQASGPVAGASQLVLTITNRGDGADVLVGADTDAALAVEIHRTDVDADGRASMRMLDEIALPAGEAVAFRPGDLHLMVVVPDERVRVGGTFEVTLRFARSAPVDVTVDVVELLDLVERALHGG